MKLSKEQLLSIGDLRLADRLDKLSEEQLDKYGDLLWEFVELYPSIEADFKKALFIGDDETLSRVFLELAELLANIHADGLVQECGRIRAAAAEGKAGHEKLEADLTSLLAAVATLSVDIQLEQHKNAEAVKPKTRQFLAVTDRQKNILAVDDIPVTLNFLKSILQEAGYKFNGVTSGEAALDYVSKSTPDLFILDIEMPKMSGFELAVKLKEAGQNAPVIFLTGNTTREYLLQAIRFGAVDFIVKPVSAESVTAKIKKILKTG